MSLCTVTLVNFLAVVLFNVGFTSPISTFLYLFSFNVFLIIYFRYTQVSMYSYQKKKLPTSSLEVVFECSLYYSENLNLVLRNILVTEELSHACLIPVKWELFVHYATLFLEVAIFLSLAYMANYR